MQLRIGELAKTAGCPVVTIRFYEKEGLLPAPERDKSNYRVYSSEDLNRLRFILHCRRHGISLDEIRSLLAFRQNPGRDCAFAHELIGKRLACVEEQLKSLQALKEELARLNCKKGCQGSCAIIEELGAPDRCPFCEKTRGST